MERKVVKLSVVITAVLGVIAVFLFLSKDRIGPDIRFDENSDYRYSLDSSDEELLQGVTAIDDRDGNVTESLMIESVKRMDEDEFIKVIYVAMDQSKNVTKVKKIYPIYEISVVEEADEKETDIEDSNASEIKMDVDEDSELEAISQDAPQIFLKEEEITINMGGIFNKLSWVDDIVDDGDSREQLYQNIQIDGDVNTDVAGTYELIYYVVDSDGNRSNEALLTVIVKSAA